MKSKYDVSILCVTYNPKLEKIISTLDSIINQKDVTFEIIISDDGSEVNYFEDIKKYMQKHNFKNYILVENKTNQGTVKNLYSALLKASGQYVKPISPGDELINNRILCNWIKELKISKKAWSFSDACYYIPIGDNQKKFIKADAHPRRVKYFINQDYKKAKVNYVVYADVVLGAATICETSIMLKYITKIIDKVIYAEDHMYYLLVFDNIMPYYYQKNTIYYEYGLGVSTTKNNKWRRILRKDYENIMNILTEQNDVDDFQKKIIEKIIYRRSKKFPIRYYLNPIGLKYFYRLFLIKRKTKIEEVEK